MKRGFVVGVAGVAIVVAGLAGCSSNKTSTSNGTAASGTGKAKVTIDGKDQTSLAASVASRRATPSIIAIGDASGGLGAVLTTGDSPTVKSVALGNMGGQMLAYTRRTGQGDATVTKDGKTYKITGHAISGVDMSNPMAGPQTQPFEIEVTCP